MAQITNEPVADDPVESGGDALELGRFLPYRLSVVSNLVSKAFARRYEAAFGLSIPEWRVMAVLGRYAPASSAEICARTAMDKAKVSRAVARLVAGGLVSRKDNPLDQRQNVLALSRKGRSVYQQIVPLARTLEREVLETLSADEVRQLDALLTKLHARAEAMAPGSGEGVD
ncbi:MarR family winged helix-turn-helix transcriptional regulator [Azospirillum sp.]|uniref:MarR family winged helix-turn-helix transcriptional regulator n=1 Tax=Azospirillum sp. TaxID=34012 RepID=UPI003D747986